MARLSRMNQCKGEQLHRALRPYFMESTDSGHKSSVTQYTRTRDSTKLNHGKNAVIK